MSLSKQLLILISVMFLAIFAVNYITSITNIRSYLEIESEIHAQDTATSLGLSLSPYIIDEMDPMLETMINAIFDRGYYREILLENPNKEELIRKTNPKTFTEVPDWFISALPMRTATANSEISSGWTIGGTVYVTISPGFGYLKLWDQAKRSFYYSVLAFVISIIVLLLVLRLVLRPLAKIDRLAISIADGNFDTIDELPWTTEVRNVALSMNMMSGKIEGVIRNLNTKLEETSQKLRVDELTGLDVKGTFETDLKQLFMQKEQGYVFIVRIDKLGELARDRGNTTADRFVKDFAQTLTQVAEDTEGLELKAYRFVGAEFAMIAAALGTEEAEKFCANLMEAFTELAQTYELDDVAHVGGVAFDPLGNIPRIVSAATEAYEKAKQIGPNSFAFADSEGESRDMDQWRELVNRIIDESRFELRMVAQAERLTGPDAGTLVLEEAVTEAVDDTGETLPIGTFVSVAESLGRVVDFDKAVVAKVIDYVKSSQLQHDVAVNLSFDSIANVDFRSWLFKQLETDAQVANRLVFSITAYGATRDLETFKSWIDFVHRAGAQVILKRFETKFIELDALKEYKLDYIRLARFYTQGIGVDEQKRRLVEAMNELGGLLDVKIVAEAVAEDDDLDVVRSIGLFAASR